MNTVSASLPSAAPAGPGLWRWLLRSLGLEAWFRQPAAVARTGQQERVFLLLSLPGATPRPGDSRAALLTEALAECRPAIEAGGGEVVSYQAAAVLLSWPVAQASQQAQAVGTYFQLRDSVRRLAGQPAASLCGAASLGWVAPRPAKAQPRYRGAVLASVAGMLRAGQQLGADLLVSAALHQRLDPVPAFQYQLEVAFDVAGHRYPATLFRVSIA